MQTNPLTPTPLESLTLRQIYERTQQIRLTLARRTLLGFTKHTYPDYEINWHHAVTANALDDVLEGRCRRLIILMPPQNGKSELVSRRFPAYALGRFPNKRITAASYGADLAGDMSRDVQKIVDSREYRQLFPETRLAEKGARGDDNTGERTQRQFTIPGFRGHYVSAGVGGALTGKSADIGIIDDPVKNREEAESETYRNKVWSWYTSTFATRQFGNTGAIIICVTRWHQDDLVGRLLDLAKKDPAADQWRVIRFEAIAEEPDAAIDPRSVGEALWPAKYPLQELLSRKAVAGAYDWNALYQQSPTSPGGVLFKRTWFTRFADAAPALARRVRGWDTAGTEGDGDWTCGVRISEAQGTFYVEDVIREQLGPNGVDELITSTTKLDRCPQREEKEGGSAGAAVIAARAKTLKGYDYAGVPITGSKITRSKPFRAQCEAGNVVLVKGPWNSIYVDELCNFPTGKHDDQVDASSAAFNAVLLEPEPIRSATWGRR